MLSFLGGNGMMHLCNPRFFLAGDRAKHLFILETCFKVFHSIRILCP